MGLLRKACFVFLSLVNITFTPISFELLHRCYFNLVLAGSPAIKTHFSVYTMYSFVSLLCHISVSLLLLIPQVILLQLSVFFLAHPMPSFFSLSAFMLVITP